MRASVGRGRVLLVLLFALLSMAGATTPAAASGYAVQSRAVALGGLAPDTPATHHDLRDWLRLPVATRHALSTPDSWWAVCAHTAGALVWLGRSSAGVAAGAAVAVGIAATPSTRAPPVRVN